MVADLGAHGTFIFCIPLNGKVDNRFLMLVLQKTEGDKGTTSASFSHVSRDVPEIYGHSRPSLKKWGMSGSTQGPNTIN
jgi:hypothetical protein